MPRPRRPAATCDCLECRGAPRLTGIGADPVDVEPVVGCVTIYVEDAKLSAAHCSTCQLRDDLDTLAACGSSGILAVRVSGADLGLQCCGARAERPLPLVTLDQL